MTGPGSAVLAGQSDARLVALARAGGEGAFEAIVRRYRRPLLRHCSKMLPPARAEDAVQQAFMRAFKGIRDGDNEIKLRPWLYRIAHNCALNALREGGWDHAELDEEIDGVERPPEAAARRARVGELVAAINDLPERQRRAIVLREFEGRSYGEISDALDVTDGAVRMLLTRARSALRGAVSVITPPGLLLKLEAFGDSGVAQRVAETGGGGVLAVKLTAGVLTATTLFAGGQLLVRGTHRSDAHRQSSSPSPVAAVRTHARAAGAARAEPVVASARVPHSAASRSRSAPAAAPRPQRHAHSLIVRPPSDGSSRSIAQHADGSPPPAEHQRSDGWLAARTPGGQTDGPSSPPEQHANTGGSGANGGGASNGSGRSRGGSPQAPSGAQRQDGGHGQD